MHQSSFSPRIDEDLLGKFDEKILSRTPHIVGGEGAGVVTNPTPLVDLSAPLSECAKAEYGIRIDPKMVRVFGKLDSQIFGGSVKVRPAVEIIRDAIINGKLRSGQKIFEATSGNFGLALGMLRDLGLEVIVLVSRRLQGGVLDELKNEGVRSVNLDVDICPAPGLKIDQNLVVAKGAAASIREQLAQLGLDTSVFDNARKDVEACSQNRT